MGGLIQSLVEISLSMAAVLAVLLLLRPVFKKYLRAKWAYWAWLLVAVRLLIPMNLALPQAPVAVYIPQPGFSVDIPVAFTPGAAVVAATDPLPVAATVVMDGWTVVACVWALGCVVALVLNLTPYFRFRRQVGRWSLPLDAPEFDALLKQLGAKGLRLLRCSAVTVPMVSGFFRPALLVPQGDLPLEPILRHEIIHFKRRDLWYKLLLLVAECVHWFNPLVWLMGRAANRDLERACDEAVTAGKEAGYCADYGRAILDAVDASYVNRTPLTSYFHGGRKAMLERLASILNTQGKKRGVAALALVLAAAVLGAGFISTAVVTPTVEHPETLSRSPDGIHTLSYVQGEGAGSLWSLYRRERLVATAPTPGFTVWQTALWSPDGRWASVRGGDGIVLLYEETDALATRQLGWSADVYTPIAWSQDGTLNFSYVRKLENGLESGTAWYEPTSNAVVDVTEDLACTMVTEAPPQFSRMSLWALPLPDGTELIRDSDGGAEFKLDGASIGSVRRGKLKTDEKNGTTGLQSLHMTGEGTYLESAYPMGNTDEAWRLQLDVDLLRQDLAQAIIKGFLVNGVPAYAVVVEQEVTLVGPQDSGPGTPDRVTMTWTNHSGQEVTFGDYFTLEHDGENGWSEVVPQKELAVHDIGWFLVPGGVQEKHYPIAEYYGKLSPGDYRIKAYCYLQPVSGAVATAERVVYGAFSITPGG